GKKYTHEIVKRLFSCIHWILFSLFLGNLYCCRRSVMTVSNVDTVHFSKKLLDFFYHISLIYDPDFMAHSILCQEIIRRVAPFPYIQKSSKFRVRTMGQINRPCLGLTSLDMTDSV